MGISRRTFIKGLGSGLTALGLSDVILRRPGWAGSVAPAKITKATATTSICPYCGVGCGLVAYTKNGKLVAVEGDPDHPVNQGTLCSKGQAVFEVVTSPRRSEPLKTCVWSRRSWDTSTWPPPGFIPIRVNEELGDAMKIIRNGRG